ncbi:MAG: c-type cytochrome biogenesis protein CcmI [Pararhodobacter sp.]
MEMTIWTFWLPAALMAAVVAALAILGLLRGAALTCTAQDHAGSDAAEAGTGAARPRAMRIYADQLREIERDLARGLVDTAEAERLRNEIAHRLLDADRRRRPALTQAPPAMRALAVALVALSIVLAGVLYWREGAPLYPDLPLAERHAQAAQMRQERPSQAELETAWMADPQRATLEADDEFIALIERLRAALQDRPDDLQGHVLLARNEANLGNHERAAVAQRRVLTLLGARAGPAEHVFLAEQMILAAGGVVSPEAEAVIETILRADPANGPARYYTGLMFAQTGRPDLTFRLWRSLLEDSRPEAPWVGHIRATIEDLAVLAGVRYTLPPLAAQGARGPSDSEIAAAMELDEAERAAMIGAMVEGLSARLGTQGGNAGEWARLIAALGVLGQTERARAIWAEARLVFADEPDQLRVIDDAARPLGFGE